jgi:hypothetical protein
MVFRPGTEIDEQVQRAMDGIEMGSRYPGMSYEEGVRDALEWVQGNTSEKPMEDD